MTTDPTAVTEEKQITIDVPADRVAEFYAFYGSFLAGFPGRRRRHGRGSRGHGCHGRRGEATEGQQEQAAPGPETASA